MTSLSSAGSSVSLDFEAINPFFLLGLVSDILTPPQSPTKTTVNIRTDLGLTKGFIED